MRTWLAATTSPLRLLRQCEHPTGCWTMFSAPAVHPPSQAHGSVTQGFWMSRPVPAAELDHWLSNRPAVDKSAQIPPRLSSVALG
jgi:hypothetical protein